MKFKNKKLIITAFISLSTLLTLTACSSRIDSPTKNTALKLDGSENFINTGKMSSPWRDINIFTRLSFRNIFTVDANSNEIKPDLATDYTLSEDALVYTINFRDDLIWSDGEKITIDDVVFSFKALLKDEEYSTIFASTFSYISGANDFITGVSDRISGLVVNDNTLEITLSKPITNFAHVLAQFTILPKHILEYEDWATISNNDFWLSPIVSGMYEISEHIPGEQLIFTYNSNYIDDIPNISSIVVRDDYEFKELDYYTTNNISEIMDFRAISHMKEIEIDSLYYKYFVYNIDKSGELDPVMSDIRVRQAIAYAIDNEKIVSDIYYKTATPIDSGLVRGSDRAYTYDPEKSKQLLKEANYDFNRPLVLYYENTDNTTAKFMSVISEYLEEVGFNVELTTEGNIYQQDGDYYDVALKGLSAFDITEWYAEYHSSHDLYKYVYGGEALFDSYIDNFNATVTEEERLDALEELQKVAYEMIYKYPIFMMGYKAYTNESRLTLPEGVILGNPRYKYDNVFEDWILVPDED